MAFAYRTSILAAAILGFGAGSQAPEFSQQYRQRIGGAIEELGKVVRDFDADAAQSGLPRRAALERMASADDRLVRDRAASMSRAIRRYEHLVKQEAELVGAPPVLRPLLIVRAPDRELATGVWSNFQPAIPASLTGLVYGGAGALVLGILVAGSVRLGALGRERRRRNREIAALKAQVDKGRTERNAVPAPRDGSQSGPS